MSFLMVKQNIRLNKLYILSLSKTTLNSMNSLGEFWVMYIPLKHMPQSVTQVSQ